MAPLTWIIYPLISYLLPAAHALPLKELAALPTVPRTAPNILAWANKADFARTTAATIMVDHAIHNRIGNDMGYLSKPKITRAERHNELDPLEINNVPLSTQCLSSGSSTAPVKENVSVQARPAKDTGFISIPRIVTGHYQHNVLESTKSAANSPVDVEEIPKLFSPVLMDVFSRLDTHQQETEKNEVLQTLDLHQREIIEVPVSSCQNFEIDSITLKDCVSAQYKRHSQSPSMHLLERRYLSGLPNQLNTTEQPKNLTGHPNKLNSTGRPEEIPLTFHPHTIAGLEIFHKILTLKFGNIEAVARLMWLEADRHSIDGPDGERWRLFRDFVHSYYRSYLLLIEYGKRGVLHYRKRSKCHLATDSFREVLIFLDTIKNEKFYPSKMESTLTLLQLLRRHPETHTLYYYIVGRCPLYRNVDFSGARLAADGHDIKFVPQPFKHLRAARQDKKYTFQLAEIINNLASPDPSAYIHFKGLHPESGDKLAHNSTKIKTRSPALSPRDTPIYYRPQLKPWKRAASVDIPVSEPKREEEKDNKAPTDSEADVEESDISSRIIHALLLGILFFLISFLVGICLVRCLRYCQLRRQRAGQARVDPEISLEAQIRRPAGATVGQGMTQNNNTNTTHNISSSASGGAASSSNRAAQQSRPDSITSLPPAYDPSPW